MPSPRSTPRRRAERRVIAELPDKDVPPPSLEECQDLLGDGKVEVVVEDLSGRRFDEVPDPSTISYAELVDKFFTLHPYQYESKPQYMSALFYLNDAQREVAQAKIIPDGATILAATSS